MTTQPEGEAKRERMSDEAFDALVRETFEYDDDITGLDDVLREADRARLAERLALQRIDKHIAWLNAKRTALRESALLHRMAADRPRAIQAEEAVNELDAQIFLLRDGT